MDDTHSNTDLNNSSSQSQSKNTGEATAERQVAQRSRWQAVLLEAGGLSAALSEESMRRLKYCLQWLQVRCTFSSTYLYLSLISHCSFPNLLSQYATAHIDAQILILRDFIANLQPLPSDTLSASRRPPISEDHMRKLTDVRRDIVHTIRQVVDVVSKYAGGALPEPARGRVRGFILKLPQRWASKAGSGAGGGVGAGATSGLGMSGGEREGLRERETVAAAAGTGMGVLRQRPGGQRRAAQRERGVEGARSGTSSRAPSPSASRSVLVNGAGSSGSSGTGESGNGVPASAALVASQRILALATESLDMMRNVTGVVKESLDRADAYVFFFIFRPFFVFVILCALTSHIRI